MSIRALVHVYFHVLFAQGYWPHRVRLPAVRASTVSRHMTSPVRFDLKNIPMRCINPVLGTQVDCTTRLEELEVAPEDLELIPQGSWQDFCFLHGIKG